MPPKKKSTKKAATEPNAKKPATPKPAEAAKAKSDAKPRKLSAIDAAARVLAEAKEPMTTRQMIEAMASKGLWTSPGGATPHATLYAVVTRVPKTS